MWQENKNIAKNKKKKVVWAVMLTNSLHTAGKMGFCINATPSRETFSFVHQMSLKAHSSWAAPCPLGSSEALWPGADRPGLSCHLYTHVCWALLHTGSCSALERLSFSCWSFHPSLSKTWNQTWVHSLCDCEDTFWGREEPFWTVYLVSSFSLKLHSCLDLFVLGFVIP